MSELVSIIMCSFNHEDYVETAIKSVIDQVYERWEMIIIDDCSTDATYQKAQAVKDSRIQVHRLPANSGFGHAYNLGLELSRGGIIMNIGSDDAFHPGKISRQVDYLRSNPTVGIVGTHITTNFDIWSRNSDPVSDWFNTAEDLNDPSLWVWRNHLAQSSVAIRADVHRSLGLLDPTLPHTLDWELWLRALVNGIVIGVIPEVLTFHRVIPGSVTHSDPLATGNEYMEACNRYFIQWLRSGHHDSDIIDLINIAIDRYNGIDIESQIELRSNLFRLLSGCPEAMDLLIQLRAREVALFELRDHQNPADTTGTSTISRFLKSFRKDS